MRRTTVFCLLAVAVALPVSADTVRLKNGRAYEGVIAERTPKGVRVQLAFGQLLLPDDQVVAIEKGESALAAFLARKAALEAKDASAAEWLELARWAKVHDLSTSARQAVLTAAELDPRLPGIDAMLRPMGLVFEESLVRWIPFEESMARRGLVRYEGEWISVQEQRQRIAQHERRRALEAQEEASRRMAAAAEAMQRSEERRARREAWERQQELERAYLPVVSFPGFWVPQVVVVVKPPSAQPQPPGSPMPPVQTPPQHNFGRLQRRPAGSFLPLDDPSFDPPAMSSSSGN
jgi:hypothetical protein